MPTPPTPSLAVAATSPTSFLATVTGGSASATHTLYYRPLGSQVTSTGGSIVGLGAFPEVGNLAPHSHHLVWCVAEEGGFLSLPAFSAVALSSPDRLSQAIHARFAGSPALAAAVAGGLWTAEVPEGVEYPYAWLDIARIDTAYTFESRGEYAYISVSIYALGADAAESTMAAWKGRFDGQRLSFSAESQTVSILFVPTRYRLAGEGLRHSSGRLVFRCSQGYHAILQRPR